MYATVDEVQGEFKNIEFSADTFVSLDDIERFIADADSLIESYVGAKYVIPITAAAGSVALMRLYSVTLVADRIKKILEVKQATNVSANQDVRGAFSSKDVMAALKAIKEGKTVLPGATLLANSGLGVFSSYTSENNIEPVFKKEEEQW